jgi:lysophospholipase L1-like esterase
MFGSRLVLFPRFHEEAAYGPFRIRCLRPQTVFTHRSVDGKWVFRTNRQGFRDDHDYAYQKRTNCIRVLCLGDSHTEGFESSQHDTFSQVLERYATAHHCEVEVLNAGVSGFGTAEELIFLENEGFRYQPDFVVLAFFANDLDDNVKSDLFRLTNACLVTNKLEHLPGVRALRPLNNFFLTRWLSQNSYAYSLVLNSVWDTMKARLSRKAAETIPAEYAIPQAPHDKQVEAYQEQLTSALIQRMSQSCQAHGFQLLIVDIPNRLNSDWTFVSSIPPGLATVMAEHSRKVFWSTNLFADFQNALPIFVAHGQHHISQLAHDRIGVSLATEILAERPPGQVSGDAGDLQKRN